MELSDEEYEQANKRGEEMKRAWPSAISVLLSQSFDHLQISLSSGRVLNVPLSAFPQLSKAERGELANVEISSSGFGIYFPDLDLDLYVPALLEQYGPDSADEN
jgi:hypothetical protein